MTFPAAVMREIVARVERLGDLPVSVELPIIEHPNELAIREQAAPCPRR